MYSFSASPLAKTLSIVKVDAQGCRMFVEQLAGVETEAVNGNGGSLSCKYQE